MYSFFLFFFLFSYFKMNIPKIKDITKEILERIITELKTPENVLHEL